MKRQSSSRHFLHAHGTCRWGMVLLSLWLCVACTPTIDAPGPAVTEARIISHSDMKILSTAPVPVQAIMTPDLSELPLRAWRPDDEPEAVVIALHGFNDYSHAFTEVGKFLASQGIALYAYDQRGFGQSPHPGEWPGETALSDDLITVIKLIKQRHPGTPVYLLGESMGGAVVMVTVMRPEAPSVNGVILSAPAIWGRGDMNFLQRGALWLTSHIAPWLRFTGEGLDIWPSDNHEMLRELSRDPLVIKESQVNALHGLCDLMDHAQAMSPKLFVPTLVLYGEKDQVIPAGPSYRMMTQLPTHLVTQTRAIYPNGYHMLMRDLQAKVVWTDISAWIKQRTAPLPSGADRHAEEVLAQYAVEEKEGPAWIKAQNNQPGDGQALPSR